MAKKKLTYEEMLEDATDVQDPYIIPSNWIWVKWKYLSDNFQYGYTAKANSENIGPKYIRITDLSDGNIDFANAPYCNINSVDYEKYVVRKNDILIARMGSVGENGVAIEDIDAVFASYLIRLRVKEISSLYFKCFLQSNGFWQQVNKNKKGTTRANINAQMLREFVLPIAPIAEQKRIVEKLEGMFEKLDKAKELLQECLDEFENRRSAILHKAFTGELTKKWREENGVSEKINHSIISKYYADDKRTMKQIAMYSDNCYYDDNNWLICKIGYIGRVKNGSTPSRKIPEYWDGNISWVSSGEVRNNRISETCESITKQGYDNSSVELMPKGTVLIAMIGEGKTRGQSSILDIDATTNQNVAAIEIAHNQVEPEILWYWLLYKYNINREIGSGNGPKALNCSRVRQLDFIVPPLAEQNEIVSILDNILEKEDKTKELISAIDDIEIMKKTILAKAFRGELGTGSEDDEDAMELLKRICRERANESTNVVIPKVTRYTIEKSVKKMEDVIKILASKNGEATPDEVYKNFDLEIDEFYKQLKKYVNENKVKEITDSEGIRKLVMANEN